MVDVARRAGAEPVPRQEIADRQGISPDYVAQLFRHLAEAGLIEGVKGPGGGYRLARPPTAIKAHDVVVAVEGPIALVDCVVHEDHPSCNRAAMCVTRQLWKRLSEAMADILSSVTLADLTKQANQAEASERIEKLGQETVGT